MATIENNNLIFTEDEIKRKSKISGHTFVQLDELDPFTKWGDALIYMHGILPKETIDEKYMLRGDFTEQLIRYVYKRDGHKIEFHDAKSVGYDDFKQVAIWGGLYDILLPEEKKVIEIKSKSMKDYDKIYREMPSYEVMQGMYYAYLLNYNYFIMEYVFYDEETEKEIFTGKKPTTLKNLKRLSKEIFVNADFVKRNMDTVLEKLNFFRKNFSIPLDAVSDDVLEKLGLTRPTVDMWSDFDLPF